MAHILFSLAGSHVFGQINIVGLAIVAGYDEFISGEKREPFLRYGKEKTLINQNVLKYLHIATAQIV